LPPRPCARLSTPSILANGALPRATRDGARRSLLLSLTTIHRIFLRWTPGSGKGLISLNTVI
jgi:hypothetical protein